MSCSETPQKDSGINDVDHFLFRENDVIDIKKLTEDVALLKFVNIL